MQVHVQRCIRAILGWKMNTELKEGVIFWEKKKLGISELKVIYLQEKNRIFWECKVINLQEKKSETPSDYVTLFDN